MLHGVAAIYLRAYFEMVEKNGSGERVSSGDSLPYVAGESVLRWKVGYHGGHGGHGGQEAALGRRCRMMRVK